MSSVEKYHLPRLHNHAGEVMNIADLRSGRHRGYWLPGQNGIDEYDGHFIWPVVGSPLIMPKVARMICGPGPNGETPATCSNWSFTGHIQGNFGDPEGVSIGSLSGSGPCGDVPGFANAQILNAPPISGNVYQSPLTHVLTAGDIPHPALDGVIAALIANGYTNAGAPGFWVTSDFGVTVTQETHYDVVSGGSWFDAMVLAAQQIHAQDSRQWGTAFNAETEANYLHPVGVASEDASGIPNAFWGTDSLLIRIVTGPDAAGSYDSGTTAATSGDGQRISFPFNSFARYKLILLLDVGWFEEYLNHGTDYTAQFLAIASELPAVASSLALSNVVYGGVVDYRSNPVGTLLSIIAAQFDA